MDLLEAYGFETYRRGLETDLPEDRPIARIIAQHKGRYQVVSGERELPAELSGAYHYQLEEKGGYPVVGDYVYLSDAVSDLAIITDLLPRRSMFYRKDTWNREGIQILAANFETILLCTSLNRDFNLTRLMRYMILSNESRARIGIVLTKSDLCSPAEAEEKVVLCRKRFPDVPVLVVSSYTGDGLEQLQEFFKGTETVMLLGSSGVGKSSLVNALSGEAVMKVGAIREYDDKGHHTTVHRQILRLPKGGLLIDTPGIREVGLINAEQGFNSVYDQITQLAAMCKYRNCTHTKEDGCAVQQAIHDGQIDPDEFAEYQKLLYKSGYEEDRDTFMFDKWQRSKQRSRDLRDARKQKRRK